MSSVTRTSAPAAEASFARSETFRTFALVFAMATPVLYVICDMMNWPLFTYHPGTNRLDLGFAPAVKNEGPAMYWYGWTASTLIGSAILGGLATLLPEKLTNRIPMSLVWILPIAVLPVLMYSLKFFWRW
jgi:RsiW-degrading membrane proteinase PrsW (M82 family)